MCGQLTAVRTPGWARASTPGPFADSRNAKSIPASSTSEDAPPVKVLALLPLDFGRSRSEADGDGDGENEDNDRDGREPADTDEDLPPSDGDPVDVFVVYLCEYAMNTRYL